MKWFKHFSNASDDEKLCELEDVFGLEGYAVYWKTLEIIAADMDTEGEPKIKLSGRKLKQKLSISVQKLTKIYDFLDEIGLVSVKKDSTYFFLHCPKLLKIKDDYSRKASRKSGQTTKKVPLEVEEEVEVEVDKEDTKVSRAAKAAETKKFNSEFDLIWPFLETFKHNKNFDSAKGKYQACRKAGFTGEEIQEYYKTQHIDTKDNPDFVTQFYKAVTIGNLKNWKKNPPLKVISNSGTGIKRDAWDDAIEQAKEIDIRISQQNNNLGDWF